MSEKKVEVNFKEIDKKARYKHKEKREMAAYRDGYDSISEHVTKTYRKTQSLRETGRICGEISTIAVRSVLSKCNEMLRSPGGRVWSKLSEEDVIFIRSHQYMNNNMFKTIAKNIGEKLTKETGVKTTVSVETIRDVWKNKTHKGVSNNEGDSKEIKRD